MSRDGLEGLVGLARNLLGVIDPVLLARTAAVNACEKLGSDGASIWLREGDLWRLTMVYSDIEVASIDAIQGTTLHTCQLGAEGREKALLAGEPYCISDFARWYRSRSDVAPAFDTIVDGLDTTFSLVGVPVPLPSGEVVALLTLPYVQREPIDVSTRRDFLMQTGALIGAALEGAGRAGSILGENADLRGKLGDYEAKLALANEELRRTMHTMTHIQETEQRLVASELHDTACQCHAAALLALASARAAAADGDDSACREYLNRVEGLVRDADIQTRNVISGVRSFSEGDSLHEALAALPRQLASDGGAHVTYGYTGRPYRLPSQAATHIYRLVREATTNACRHAHASRIVITADWGDPWLTVEVADDGCGFIEGEHPGSGYGLAVMRDRACVLGGELSIDSTPGSGTRVTLRLSVD